MEKERIDSLIELRHERELEAIFIVYPPNLSYFTGFRGDNGLLVIDEGDGVKFYTDGRYTTQAEEEVNCCEVEEFRSMEDVLLGNFRNGRIAIDGVGLSYARFSGFQSKGFNGELIDITDDVYRIRAIKDEGEISFIKKAVAIQEDVMKEVLHGKMWEEMGERELANHIRCAMLDNGAEREAFDVIVAYDSDAALPHAIPGSREFAGDVVLIDWGSVYRGYHSDQTITRIDEGNPRLKEIYKIVREAQNLVFDSIRPGVKASELDKIARDYITKCGYGDYFKHSLGHGVGLEIHERPFIGSRSRDVLEAGMVFTVEPGIYIPGIGGVRLEDMVLVTEDGYKKLTQIDK